MRALLLSLLLLPACGEPPAAASPDESWLVVRIDGEDSGYLHSRRVVHRDEILRIETTETTEEARFRMRRFDQAVEVAQRTVTRESEPGGVVSMTSAMTASRQTIEYSGEVNSRDREMTVTVRGTGEPRTITIDWPDGVLGPAGAERRLLATRFEPGASFTCLRHDFTVGQPFEVTYTVVGPETIEVGGVERAAHHVRQTSSVLPPVDGWYTDDGDLLRDRTEMMGLEIVSESCDRERVAAFLDEDGRAAAGLPPGAEVFRKSTIVAGVDLSGAAALDAIVYRLRPSGARDGKLPPLDGPGQRVVMPLADGGVRLEVRKRVPPPDHGQRRPLADPPEDVAVHLAAGPMIESDAPEIVTFATDAVGAATDAWRAAVLLEDAVHRHMANRSNLDVAFASALESLRSAEGDCSEHAVLLAAACRAAGIPARVALGLVHAQGLFGGHAWTEVWIAGDWYGLDATQGRGFADPTHLRFGATGLEGGAFGVEMVRVLQSLGGLELEVVELERDGKSEVPLKEGAAGGR